MTPTEAARRLVGLEGWEWRDGMQSAASVTYYDTGGAYSGEVPDLEDDATRGIVLGTLSRRVGAYCWLERAGSGDRVLWAARSSADDGTRDTLGTGASWAEAFVRAWEATPPHA